MASALPLSRSSFAPRIPFAARLVCRSLSSYGKEIPNPRHTPSAYSPHYDYSVIVDPDGFLTAEEGRRIESQIRAMTDIKVTVLILRRLEGKGPEDNVHDAAAKFVQDLHQEWGLGDPVKQNGLLLFISVEDRVVYMSFGGGVESLITEDRIESIISAMKIYLRSREYAKAIEFALSGLLNAPELPGNNPSTDYTTYGFLLLLFALLLPSGNREESPAKGAEKLRDILWQLSLIREEEYFPTTCPHCLVNKVEKRSDGEGFICGHTLCSTCSRKIAASSLASCPICKDSAQAVDGNGYAVIATPEELSLLRITDICYRLRRLHGQHPRLLPADLMKTLETRIQCEDYVGARVLGEDRLKSLGAPVDDTTARSSSELVESRDSSSSDDPSSSSHYGGGSASGGRGSSW